MRLPRLRLKRKKPAAEKTLNLKLHVREVTDEQAEKIAEEAAEAVFNVIGRMPNVVDPVVEPEFTGKPRSKKEADRAAAEGRR